MAGEIEGAGDIVTGGLIAHALEPRTGEGAGDGHGPCLNCGAALKGAYCHRCGQSAHVHRSLSAIWHDIAHGVLHFEGKIWHTLPLLITRPGELTRRYIAGERARFVSPMALFLFSIFLMFAILSILGSHLEAPVTIKDEVGAEVTAEIKIQREELVAELADIDAKIAAAVAKGHDTGDLRRERANISGLKRIVEGGPSVLADRGKFTEKVRTGWYRLDKGIAKATENPNLLLYKLQTNAYKFSWALIPLSVPFVWLLFFWDRRWRFYDHTIFVTYSLGFMTLLSIVAMLLGAAGMPAPALITGFAIIAPVHIFVQLKQAYGQTTAIALVRTFLLLNFAAIALAFFIVLLIGMGLLG